MPQLDYRVKFRYGLQSRYDALTPDVSTVYFCTDTQRLFVGDIEYTRPVLSGPIAPTDAIISANPTNVLYLDTTTHELYVSLAGNSWIKVTDAAGLSALTGRIESIEDLLSNMQSQIGGLTGAMHFLGEIDTDLTDGSTDANIIVDGDSVKATAGDVVIYESAEYVFNGTRWSLLGDTADYLLKDVASATYETRDSASGKLTEAKTYTDSTIASAKTALAADATSKAESAVASAKTYTDAAVKSAALTWGSF